MITGFVVGYVKDEAFDKAFEQLEKSFDDNQKLEYLEVCYRDDKASNSMWAVFALAIVSLFASNYFFWWLDVGFFYIFLVNLMFPYMIYKVMKGKAKAVYNKLKFYSTLSANMKNMGSEAQEALKKFIK